MADLGGKFNARAIEPDKGFRTLPAGDYIAVVTDSIVKQTNAGDGAMLKLTFQVVEGEFAGSKIWENLNMWNQSKKTVDIANARFSALCHAVGVLEPGDSEEVHNKRFLASVYHKKGDDGKIEVKIGKFSPVAVAANYTPPVQPRQTSVPSGVPVAQQRAAKRAAGDKEIPF